jgi:hypothetical protein
MEIIAGSTENWRSPRTGFSLGLTDCALLQNHLLTKWFEQKRLPSCTRHSAGQRKLTNVRLSVEHLERHGDHDAEPSMTSRGHISNACVYGAIASNSFHGIAPNFVRLRFELHSGFLHIKLW